MKNLKYYFLILFSATTLSCGDNFGDLNVDPNNPTLVPAEFLFTSAQKSLADDVWDAWMNARFGLLVAQYWAQNNYTDESRYNFRQEVINGYFGDYYARPLLDLQEIKRLINASDDAGSARSKNQIAATNILQCWLFQFLTDVWGPVPYSEALKGSENRTPKYDSQRDIYLSILATLQEAKDAIDPDAEGFGSADNIYGGDMSKWKKLAASLILRVAMRMSDVEGTTAKAAIEAAYADAFTSNDDNAYFRYLSGQPNNNLLNQDRIERGDSDFCISDILIDNTLVPLNDPRVGVFADPRVNGGDFVGRPFGQSSNTAAGEAPADYCQPSGANAVAGNEGFEATDVLAPEAPFVLLNYAEVCFILAEARERNWNVSGDAATWYHAGITASIQEWSITDDGVISAYLAQPAVNYLTAEGDWKQKIGVQKWIALYMQGVQGWSEWRRLDFNKLELPVEGVLSDIGANVAPVRLTYPTNEQTQNAASYNEALGLLGGPDKQSTRVWWDVE